MQSAGQSPPMRRAWPGSYQIINCLFVETDRHLGAHHDYGPADQVGVLRHQLDGLLARRRIRLHAHGAIQIVPGIEELLVVSLANQLVQFTRAQALREIDVLRLDTLGGKVTPRLPASGSGGFQVDFHAANRTMRRHEKEALGNSLSTCLVPRDAGVHFRAPEIDAAPDALAGVQTLLPQPAHDAQAAHAVVAQDHQPVFIRQMLHFL